MADKVINFNDPEATPGVITKISSITPIELTDSDLKKINKYTLSPVSANDVYIFKATIADNEQDDRNYMPFNLKALKDLFKLYPGKTMLMDHSRKATNQIGRVYETELQQNESKTTALGELHTELMAKIYMIRTDSNKDLIAEINGGIKKEVSTSTIPEKMICSICGTDNMRHYCRHWPGREYETTDTEGKTIKRRCTMLLHGAADAHELSFVAVPAQPRAGTHKSIGFTKPVEEKETPTAENKKDPRLLNLRIKNAENYSKIYNERNVTDNE